ncbi:MAG: hypothetical protein RLZZ453_1213 [Chlamydiota bacterium]|jgi:uncharacterized membrane protein
MKKYFFTGLAALLPIALTCVIAIWLFNLFTDPLAGLTESFVVSYEEYLHLSPEKHHVLVVFISRLLALVVLVVLIFLLGLFGHKFLMKFLLRASQTILGKIPLVRTIFNITNDISKALFSDSANAFQSTVLLAFPQKDSHALGFITKEAPDVLKKSHPNIEVIVFVPTAPHPISGFLLFMKREDAQKVDISPEEAFKFLISCGTVDLSKNKNLHT